MADHDHPYRPQYAPALPRQLKTSALAVVAFVCACLFFVPFAPLVGGILGIAATVRVSARRDRLGGLGLAIAAIPVGFVCFFFLQGILAAIAIPAFVKYMRSSKTVEARVALDRLRSGASSFYLGDRFDEAGNPLPRRFPAGRTGWVPAASCCDETGGGACRARDADWNVDPWRALRFQLAGTHYFQMRYESSGEGPAARFEAEARADLDCDGRFSSYALKGWIDADGSVRTEEQIRDRLE